MSRGLQLTNERNSFCVLSLDATHSACSIRYVDAGLKTIFLCWLYDSIATKVIKLMLIRWLSDPIRERRLRANESPQYWKNHLKTSLEPCTFWKQNLSVLTFLSFWPLLTKPTPTQQWSGIISYLCFETFFWIFDCSICSRQTVLCSGANSRFSYTDSEYNYGATKIIFPIINQKI